MQYGMLHKMHTARTALFVHNDGAPGRKPTTPMEWWELGQMRMLPTLFSKSSTSPNLCFAV